jgi:hypothetical protein
VLKVLEIHRRRRRFVRLGLVGWGYVVQGSAFLKTVAGVEVPGRQGSRDKIAIQDLGLASHGSRFLRNVGSDGEVASGRRSSRDRMPKELMHSPQTVKRKISAHAKSLYRSNGCEVAEKRAGAPASLDRRPGPRCFPDKGAECDGRGRRAIANLARRPIAVWPPFHAAPLLQQDVQHACSKMSDFKWLYFSWGSQRRRHHCRRQSSLTWHSMQTETPSFANRGRSDRHGAELRY